MFRARIDEKTVDFIVDRKSFLLYVSDLPDLL